jgi:excisionase family DNA binding protein
MSGAGPDGAQLLTHPAERKVRSRTQPAAPLGTQPRTLRHLVGDVGGMDSGYSDERTTSTTSPDRWLTAPEAAAYLGLPSHRALYQAIRRGQVRAHRLGRRLRFRAAELDAVLTR